MRYIRLLWLGLALLLLFTAPLSADVVADTAIAGDTVSVSHLGPAGIDLAGWKATRFAAAATGGSSLGDWRSMAHNQNNSNFQFYRTAFTFDLTEHNVGATAVDSVRLYLSYAASTLLAAGGDSVVFVLGEWTGRFTATSEWDEFDGFAEAAVDSVGAFEFTPIAANMAVPYNTAAVGSVLFTAAGKAQVLSALGTDTLRVMVLNANEAYDIRDYTYREHLVWYTEAYPSLMIYYSTGVGGGPASVAGITSPASVSGVASPTSVSGVN